MVGCQDAKKGMSFYLEGDIPKSECREITTHLKHCPFCKADVERFRKLQKYLNSLEEIKPPETMAPQIMSSILNLAPNKNKKIQNRIFKILIMIIGAFSIPFFILLLRNVFTASHQAYSFYLTSQDFFTKLIMLVAKTLASIFNDSPLLLDLRFLLPSFQFRPLFLLILCIFVTLSIFFSSIIFILTLPKNHLPVKK